MGTKTTPFYVTAYLVPGEAPNVVRGAWVCVNTHDTYDKACEAARQSTLDMKCPIYVLQAVTVAEQQNVVFRSL